MKQARTLSLVFAIACASSQAGTYIQNFDSVPLGTTGTGLNDGSNMVASGWVGGPQTFSSTQWGAGVTPDNSVWNALFMTPMSQGILSNFFLPNLDPEQPSNATVTGFTIDFSLLINYINRTNQPIADGFSLNFGRFNNTTGAYGGEGGMYSPVDGKTGDVLTVSWITSGNARIEARYNGATIATSTVVPSYNVQNPPAASAFLPVSISWSEDSGLSVSYNGLSVFDDLPTGNFTPQADYSFAMSARTGADYENLFVDNISAATVVIPEPSAALLGLAGMTLLFRRRRVG